MISPGRNSSVVPSGYHCEFLLGFLVCFGYFWLFIFFDGAKMDWREGEMDVVTTYSLFSSGNQASKWDVSQNLHSTNACLTQSQLLTGFGGQKKGFGARDLD